MGLRRGIELIRAGAYFEAHEELEEEWREAPDEERDFLQGLVHVAVAWHHAARGNRPGCERQLAKAERRLEGYRPTHRGVDVSVLLEDVASAQLLVEDGSLALPRPRLRSECGLDPDGLEEPVQVDPEQVEALEEEE